MKIKSILIGALCTFLFLNLSFAQVLKVNSGTLKRYDQFASKYVDARNVAVWLPDNYSSDKKYAVIYMHDGQMLFDAGTTWNKQEWGVDEAMGRLSKEKKIKDCIVVGVWNITNLRTAEYFPKNALNYLPEGERIKAIEGKFLADNYLKFLVEELKPFIDKEFSTKLDVQSTFLMGSSMGGLISLYGVCEYPEVFGGAACLSIHSPLLTSDRVMLDPDNEYAAALRAYVAEKLAKNPKRKFYFDYGTETLDKLYQKTQPQLDLVMQKAGYSSKYWLTKRFEGDAHDEVSWAKRLDIPILFLVKK